MSHSNPYESPQAANEVIPATTSPSVLKRIAWSIVCGVLGFGLSLVLPIMLYKIGVVKDPRGQGDYVLLLPIMLSGSACIISCLFGIIVGAVIPGLRSIIFTLICLVVADIISVGACWFLPPNGELFIPLYLFSAAIKGAMIFGLNRIGTTSSSDNPKAMEA